MLKPSPNFAAAAERAELYFMSRPGSPSAVRRPRLVFRAGGWTALLGDSVKSGIGGSGKTIEEALNAFDVQYLAALRPPQIRSAIRLARRDRS